MKEPTPESIETTENFHKAMTEFLQQQENEPQKTTINRLFYNQDGSLIRISDEEPAEGDLWIEIDAGDFYSKYSILYNFLKVIDGKLVNTKTPSKHVNQTQLVPGDTWHADDDNRLIIGEPGVNTSGWSRKAD